MDASIYPLNIEHLVSIRNHRRVNINRVRVSLSRDEAIEDQENYAGGKIA